MTITDMYLEMGIDYQALGCIMLETEPLKVSDLVDEDELYFSSSMKYAQGIVSEWGTPHVTLLYGLMENGQTYRKYVDILLKGINLSNITIDTIDTFDNVDGETEYSVYVAKVKITPELLVANGNLRKLPHIDGFADYQPHISLFYAKKNEEIKPQLLKTLNERFSGQIVNAKDINYGG